MSLTNLKRKFHNIYGKEEVKTFFSPSRVNLIGEHIDYNGGYVLPCALNLGTYGCVRARNDNKIRLASGNFDLKVEVELDDLKYEKAHDWANYPKGVIYFMKQKNYNVSGMDILVWGNIPNGAGLSSSASLELLIAEMVNNLFNNGEISKLNLVKISQEAENNFIGVKCGIMDQFAVAMGKEDCAILLDCNNIKYRYIDIDMRNYKLVVMNTNKRRKLDESKYNERRRECEEALNILKRYKDMDYLCELSVEELECVEKYLTEKNIKKRVYHVVYENQRVLNACKCLEKGDIEGLGQLFKESHESLKNLYEVTGIELDTMVEGALKEKGCVGARMTGAGFGGCAIALVDEVEVDNFIHNVAYTYKKKMGYEGEFYLPSIDKGTRELTR